MTKPILSASKTPNPTLRTQCLTNLLDNVMNPKRKRKEVERTTAKKKQKGSFSSRTPSSTMTANKHSNKTNERAIDVFGGVKSGSLNLLGLSSKSDPKAKTITTAAKKPGETELTRKEKAAKSIQAAVHPPKNQVKNSEMPSSAIARTVQTKLAATKQQTAVASIPKRQRYTPPKIRPPPPSSYSCKLPINDEKSKPSNRTIVSNKNTSNRPNTQTPCFGKAAMAPSLKRPKRDFSRFVAPKVAPQNATADLDSLPADRPLALPSGTISDQTSTVFAKRTEREMNQPKHISALETMPMLPGTNSQSAKVTKPKENFIRLNLRNNNGACRGARKSSKSKPQYPKTTSNKADDTTTASSRHATVEGVDAVDDFIDGTYDQPESKKKRHSFHLCKGHQEPCKLLKVKKAGPNKGRQFYVCPCPRSEQCDHFQWADDTQEAAQVALRKNKSTSGFIARQVAAYMKNIDALTVPELKMLAQQHRLNDKGKKGQLRTRISIWVRDEIAKGLGPVNETSQESPLDDDDSLEQIDDGDEECDVSTTDCSAFASDDDELELSGCEDNALWNCMNAREGALAENSTQDQDYAAKESDDQLTSRLMSLFGHSKFRPGQEWAIRRCLDGHRSLLVAPTGMGKSLCYALPAAMKTGVTIVVSPLISLIEDQLRVLPPRLPAATLSGSMTKAATASILDDVLRGRIKLLFVSPERLVSASFRRLFRKSRNNETGDLERLFPPVSLFCVDEAHCLSQWAHNFRPCYLRLGTVLKSIEAESVLAITATAEPRVVADICSRLEIMESEEAVRLLKANRDNINVECLFMGSQDERLTKLMKILRKKTQPNEAGCKSDNLDGCLANGSVIVYVWRQMDAQIVAENIQAGGIGGGVVVYHGGMDFGARLKAQSKFMRGKSRICVATIAFGLGINKSDVAGVIHMHLSSSPEHYIQEIGRAGRGGQQARAIALILRDEVLVRHSLAHSDLISFSQCKAVLQLLQSRIDDAIAKLPEERSKSEAVTVAFPLALSVNGCDCKPETVETILSLFEQRDKAAELLHVEGAFYDRAELAPKQETLHSLAESEDVLAAILSCSACTASPLGSGSASDDWSDTKRGSAIEKSRVSGHRFGVYAFSISECANCIGSTAEPRHVFAAMRRFQNKGLIEFDLKTGSQNRYLQLRITSDGIAAFGSGSVEALANETFEKATATVASSSQKVLDLQAILHQVSQSFLCPPVELGGKSKGLEVFQNLTADYFEGLDASKKPKSDDPFTTLPNMAEIVRDAQIALQHLSQVQLSSTTHPGALRFGDLSTSDYTSLCITKFLHGLSLPSISPTLLRHHPLFGRWQDVRFNDIHDMVTSIFVRRRDAS